MYLERLSARPGRFNSSKETSAVLEYKDVWAQAGLDVREELNLMPVPGLEALIFQP
jgi:hypothetical protein